MTRNDDEWLREVAADADRVIADSDAAGAERAARVAARTARIAANAEQHRLAVRRITDVVDRTRRVLEQSGNRGKTRLFKLPGLFGRAAWGWRIEYPKQQVQLPFPGPPVAVGTAPLDVTVPANTGTAQIGRGRVRGLPEFLWLLDDGRFTTRVGDAVDDRDILTLGQLIERVLPTQVRIDWSNDRNTVSEVVDLFPLVGEGPYAAHTDSLARGLAAGLTAVTRRQQLS